MVWECGLRSGFACKDARQEDVVRVDLFPGGLARPSTLRLAFLTACTVSRVERVRSGRVRASGEGREVGAAG